MHLRQAGRCLYPSFISLSFLYILLKDVHPSVRAINVDHIGNQALDDGTLWDLSAIPQGEARAGPSAPTTIGLGETSTEDSWSYWWSYSGISGPAYWGLLNPDWLVCDKGTRQSPINIETRTLVYDANLTPLRADNNLISGLLHNDGHAIVLNCSMQVGRDKQVVTPAPNSINELLATSTSATSSKEPPGESTSTVVELDLDANEEEREATFQSAIGVHFSGAGLPYTYKLEALYLKFASNLNQVGSEHQINSRGYSAEIQLVAYNSLLYQSYTEAANKPFGLMAVAILVDLVKEPANKEGSKANLALESLLENVNSVKHRGMSVPMRNFSLSSLLPDTNFFITYQGSLTSPACHEGVHWILLNKPIYIRHSYLNSLRSISADEQSGGQTGTFIAGNVRPTQPINSRLLRTNIRPSQEQQEDCRMQLPRYAYKAGSI